MNAPFDDGSNATLASRILVVDEAILVTSYPSAEAIIATLAAGASDYLVKPIGDLQLACAKVRAALDRRPSVIERRAASRGIARQTADLLREGKDAPEEVWRVIETALERADVVVVQTVPGWRALVEAIAPTAGHVLLVATEGADLPDLLDALGLHIELIGFGGVQERALSDRVRVLLVRCAVERAQTMLSGALDDFRKTLEAQRTVQ